MKPRLPSKKHCVDILRKIGIFNVDGQFPSLEKFISREQISEIIKEVENIEPKNDHTFSSNCIVLSSNLRDFRKNYRDYAGPPDENVIEEFLSPKRCPEEKEALRMATFALLGIAMVIIRKNENTK